jgi:hypothetical protein
MTFRQLLEMMQQFAAENPDHQALDQRVVVRVGIEDDDESDLDEIYVGGLTSAVVDAGCTDFFALVLDGDQDPDDLYDDPEDATEDPPEDDSEDDLEDDSDE